MWIDALCINQNDIHERSAQVALMGKIFQQATKVLVWLGEAADDCDIVFEHIQSEEKWGWAWERPLNQQYEAAMLAIYSRPNWRRVWVIQEVLRAKSLVLFCGIKSMPMGMFHRGYCTFQEKMAKLQKDNKTPAGCLEDPQRIFYLAPGSRILRQRGTDGNTEQFSLLRLLEMCADCGSECQFVHDRIYGLIGVLKSTQQGLIIPDYSKRLSEICADVLISPFVPDTAYDSHYLSSWGYMGKDLIASSGQSRNY